jgi:DNA-binding NarL/FixJ family response regulator
VSAVRVLIADDQALVRAGFRMILDAEDDLEVVGEATDGREAVEMARRLKPDVVLMDIRMPELDGIEATRRVVDPANGEPPVRVLMLTTFDLNEYVYEALRAGASGFLLKDVPPEDLVDAIKVVAAGDALLAPSVTRRLLDRFASKLPDPAATRPAALDSLTARELEVLGLVARACPTPRSPSTWSSARPPSRPTSAASWPSSTSATASRPSSWRMRPGSSAQASPDDGPAVRRRSVPR